jgi:phosphoglycolate phosphatase
MLLRTIVKVGGEPRRAVMVGDSSTDVRTARAAAVPIIVVSFGYADVPLEALQADHIISTYSDLPEAIGTLLGVPT